MPELRGEFVRRDGTVSDRYVYPDPHPCDLDKLVNQMDHRLTEPGISGVPGSWERFVVARCPVCRDWWGVRFQHNAGTGRDDRYHRYGPDEPTRKVVAR